MTYYDREKIRHLDGTPVFANERDRANENSVAAIVEREWNCELRRFGDLSPVDWFAVRAGRIVGVIELKSRTHSAEHFPTVFLNVRKWLALQLAASGLGTPAVFIVKFTDGIKWISLSELAVNEVRIAGCRELVKSRSDIEPVIEVPVDDMHWLGRESGPVRNGAAGDGDGGA